MRKRFPCTFLAIFLAVPATAGVFYDDGATTLHFAFEGSPNNDRPIVRPPAFYHADDGFGFVDSPLLIGTATGVTAPKYFRFDVNLPDGNYDVAVTLGGTEDESITTVKAESHRPMLLDVHVAPGESVTKIFTVNVRHGPVGKDQSGDTLDTDGRLNLEFVGRNPSLMKLDIRPNTTAVTVYLAGDSSVSDHDDIPAAGWGQMLPLLFKPLEVAVSNQAGASAESAAAQDRLQSIAATIKPGDYLFIQYTVTVFQDRGVFEADWKKFLQAHIDAARRHGAIPVLVTQLPLADEASAAQWVRELAADQNVPLIDLGTKASAFLNSLAPGVHITSSSTNLSAYGALEMAKLVAQAIQDQKLDLAPHLAGNIVANSDPAKFPASLGYDDLMNSNPAAQ
jgi:lysophospholipase L1-like esterase